jgi:hypothetical protein
MRVAALIGVMVLTTAFYVRFLTALFVESKPRAPDCQRNGSRLRDRRRRLTVKVIEMKPHFQGAALRDRQVQRIRPGISELPKSS